MLPHDPRAPNLGCPILVWDDLVVSHEIENDTKFRNYPTSVLHNIFHNFSKQQRFLMSITQQTFQVSSHWLEYYIYVTTTSKFVKQTCVWNILLPLEDWQIESLCCHIHDALVPSLSQKKFTYLFIYSLGECEQNFLHDMILPFQKVCVCKGGGGVGISAWVVSLPVNRTLGRKFHVHVMSCDETWW